VKLLLDTHALIWAVSDPRRLAQPWRTRLERGDEDIWISVVSLWEIAIKRRRGKLGFDAEDVTGRLSEWRLPILDVEAVDVRVLAGLPVVAGHRDPFDQLLLAQAQRIGATFVTADRALAAYGVPTLPA
jgi:PIN domain nuclease of toxin-antitoxin system